MVLYQEQLYLCLYCCRLTRAWYKMVASNRNSQKSETPTRIAAVQCISSFLTQRCGYCPSKVNTVPQFHSFPNRKLKRFFSPSVISKMCHYWCPSTTWTLKWYSSSWYQPGAHTLQTRARWGGTVLAAEESLGAFSFCFAEERPAAHEEECEGFRAIR